MLNKEEKRGEIIIYKYILQGIGERKPENSRKRDDTDDNPETSTKYCA